MKLEHVELIVATEKDATELLELQKRRLKNILRNMETLKVILII